jgi:hypothetical protein
MPACAILFTAAAIADSVNSVAGGGSLITFPEKQKARFLLTGLRSPAVVSGLRNISSQLVQY